MTLDLIITIIVLLILVGVTLNMVMGENGIFGKANNAKNKTEVAQYEEELNIGIFQIQTNKIDIRSSVTIGSHVIIGAGTEIITTSHNIDSPDWTLKNYGITIEDYVWIPTNVLILPSCRNISYGSGIGSGSVVVKNTDPMSVVGGNPAKELRKRKCVHSNLIVESLLGGDYDIYKKTRKKRHC